jgi:3-mercaptopyruvate sulfurtransferase SseA
MGCTSSKQKSGYVRGVPPFVRADALDKAINAKSVLVLDCSVDLPKGAEDAKTVKEEYLNGHIPTAHFMDLEKCRDKSSPYANMIPPLS